MGDPSLTSACCAGDDACPSGVVSLHVQDVCTLRSLANSATVARSLLIQPSRVLPSVALQATLCPQSSINQHGSAFEVVRASSRAMLRRFAPKRMHR